MSLEKKYKWFILSCLIMAFSVAKSQTEGSIKKKYLVNCIGFWNVENLFDTIDSPNTNDTEFSPLGANEWTGDRYRKKLEHLSEVILDLGTEISPDGAAVLGLCEVENITVLEDLVNQNKLKKRNYKIIHYDSPDLRGIDVAFIYQPKYFSVTTSKTYKVTLPHEPEHPTRDILVVTGEFDGETMSFLINHWPSRIGGAENSRNGREAAAIKCRHITDSLLLIDKNAKIILMGDLNDDPNNESVTKHLNASGNKKKLQDGQLFNSSFENFKNGVGTLAYNDIWNLFDQMIVTQGLLTAKDYTYKFMKYKIYNKAYVKQDGGKLKGCPLRTFSGKNYTAGYSDHFAVYCFLMKENK